MPPLHQCLHATTVELGGKAALIRGASGSGKSALALQLMAHGARLIADDQTLVTLMDGAVIASCPPAIRGRIEARGIGLLAADFVEAAPLHLVVDLDQPETQRLPQKHQCDILGVPIDLVFGSTSRHFPFGVLQYLRFGRID